MEGGRHERLAKHSEAGSERHGISEEEEKSDGEEDCEKDEAKKEKITRK
jgi:hypothetical protein